MISTEKPCRIITVKELSRAPIADVLLYGLTLDGDDPALGVLVAIRDEIGLITSLAEQSQQHPDFDLAELVPVLEGIGRRLDVAIVLFTRAHRTAAVDGSVASESPTAPEGVTPP